MLSAGNYGCYALCLIHVAENYLGKKFHTLETLEDLIAKGYIDFNYNNYNDENNFYVNNPEKVLYFLTGKKWSVTKELLSYIPNPSDYVIELWSINGRTGHFAMTSDGFNSLQVSNCVNKGMIISYRICKVVS